MLSGDVRKAVAHVLEMMIEKPSSQQAAANALSLTQPAISKAIVGHDLGPRILARLVAFLATRGAIAEPTEGSFMRTFGPDVPDTWTWESVAAFPLVSDEQKKAIKIARLRGTTPDAVGAVLTQAPWTHAAFRVRSSDWWVGEMVIVAALAPENMPRERLVAALPEWTVDEAKKVRKSRALPRK